MNIKTIPFDYVFQFTLLGKPGNKVQDVIEISTEGVFAALSVGYSLVQDERGTPRTFGPVIDESDIVILATRRATSTTRPLSAITLGEVAAGLERIGADPAIGFRLSAEGQRVLNAGIPLNTLQDGALNRLFETGREATAEVSFLYSFDVGNTGREYQSKPIHNIAGLGIANGDRPFRPFAKPILLEPRTFVRLQIEEISGPAGTLQVVLQGYKMLGAGRISG